MNSSRIFVALIHHPVYDKNKSIITTSITNFDIHDISRSCRTYGVEKFFIVHPMESQQFFARRIIKHWQDGYGSVYNTTRREALSIIDVEPDLKSLLNNIEVKYQQPPVIIGTSARQQSTSTSYAEMRNIIIKTQVPYLILLGSGWGLPGEIMSTCDYILSPIQGNSDYNHLSVRAAGAIILDRLLSSDHTK